MKRTIESSRNDVRHRADIRLTTGKVVTLASEWKPSHWDEVESQRLVLVRDAQTRAQDIFDKFGVTSTIALYRESRNVVHAVETTVKETFHSELAGGA